MRLAVLTIALLFIVALGILTVLDFARYGITAPGVLAVLVLLLFTIGIVGALREPSKEWLTSKHATIRLDDPHALREPPKND